jgi:mevalonate kinase
METLPRDALDLINRQQAEIERLETVLDIWQVGYASMEKGVRELEEQLATAKSEAYKEFAERLDSVIVRSLELFSINTCDEFKACCQVLRGVRNDIHNLLKELG